jgi:serine/threonine-protein kinase
MIEAYAVDELLPVLVARVASRNETVPAIEAALRHGAVFLRLDEAPSYDGPHVLEIHTPDLTEPLLFLAEPAGDPIGHEHPLLLKPFAPEHEEVLMALLAEAGVRLSALPPRLVEPPMIDLGSFSIVPPPDDGAGEMEMNALSDLPPGLDLDGEPERERESILPGQSVGRILAGGKYSIGPLIGSGGMGSVYSGVHRALEKTIAIKVLHPSHRHNAEFLAAFHREALAASRLDHPNVVQVLDFGQEADGLLYITMELLNGTDLRAVLVEAPVQPLGRIVDVMSQVCAALSASHEQNVVHRDIKPENILLVPRRDDDGTQREVVKVCDFGIAEILGKQSADAGAKRAEVAGTPDYMSPEQVRATDIDARADIYACGVILFEMATGKVPFHDMETPENIAWAHLEKEPPAPSSINPAIDRHLEAVILKAIRKDPAQRHQTARDLRAELRGLLESARRDALLDTFSDMNSLPVGVVPTFERDDAIDIGDLLSLEPMGEEKPGAVKEQIWVLSERMATALVDDAGAVLAQVEALADPADYARELASLERAMASLASRGAAAALAAVVSTLSKRARGAAPGDRTHEALAARALRSIEKPELLLRIADDAMDGPPAAREPSRKVLVLLGASGAHALAAARDRAGAQGAAWGGRHRFVTAMRDVGPAALPTLAAFLQQADPRNVALLEDLLRAVAETAVGRPSAPSAASAAAAAEASDRLGALISTRDVRHAAPAVRRAAVGALAAAWGPRANAWLAPMLEDTDDGLRIAALGALRKHGGIDREAVRRIERILTGASPAGTDLRSSAAAALADAAGPARAQAVEALSLALRPAAGGFLSKLVTVEQTEDPVAITTMAQVLLALGGAEGARVVEARAARSSADLKRQLHDLLGGRPGPR